MNAFRPFSRCRVRRSCRPRRTSRWRGPDAFVTVVKEGTRQSSRDVSFDASVEAAYATRGRFFSGKTRNVFDTARPRRAVFALGARIARRIAMGDFSRKPFAAAKRAARRSRGTERRGTSQADGARSARRLVSMCRARGRDASRPAGCRDPRGSHRASSGGSVRTRRSTGGGADARGGKTRALDSEERASRSTRTELGTSPRAAAARLKHSPMTPPGCARPSDVPRQGRYLGPRQQNAFSGSRKSRLASVMSVALPIKAATLKLGRRARARHPARGESAAGIPSRT